MEYLLTLTFGSIAGLGLFASIMGGQARVLPPKRARLRSFRSADGDAKLSPATVEGLTTFAFVGVLGFGAWTATGWLVAALIGAATGLTGPRMVLTPRRRRQATDEIEAYSQWTEQIRDLVGASGSLFEALTLSAESAPATLRPKVVQMAAIARTVGLPPALDWFAAEMESPYADRLVLGMKIAWDSGARVTEAFESTAKAMRNEVDMRRRNEVANARTWTQVTAILGVTIVSVLLMFVINRSFFDPFGTLVGQIILGVIGAMIFGNVLWVLRLSEAESPVRLLASGEPDATVEMVTAAQRSAT